MLTATPGTSGGEGTIELRPSKERAVLVLIIGVGFALAGLFMWRAGASMAGGAALVFSLGIPLALRTLFDRRPYLIIDDQGVFNRYLAKRVPWDDIASARLLKQGRRQFVCLRLNHIESYLSPRSQRVLARLGIPDSEIPLVLAALDISPDKVLELIQQRLDSRRSGRDRRVARGGA